MEAEVIPLPGWLATIPPIERELYYNKFILNVAALYVSPEMSLNALADKLEISPPALHHQMSRTGGISERWVMRINRLVGSKILPIAKINPRFR
jgi:hypothetical protein